MLTFPSTKGTNSSFCLDNVLKIFICSVTSCLFQRSAFSS